MPRMYMMIGLPASGKSSLAQLISADSKRQINIHSSDLIRKELYGDEEIQGDPNKVFSTLHKRVKEDLNNDIDCIFDATNIKKKNRIAFLNSLKNIPCEKIAIWLAVPYQKCLDRNSKRERNVPTEVIRRMYMNFQPPHKSEGFDTIILEREDSLNHISDLFPLLDNFDQENQHHQLTLGKHMKMTTAYVMEHAIEDNNLIIAALLHDIGKPFTKTRLDGKGNMDTECHYYQHHCVGAYDSVFYTDNLFITESDSIDIANLVYYHMAPYREWQSKRVKKRDANILGEEMVNRIMILHDADKAAH